MMAWIHLLVSVLGAAALLGVGLVVVRPADKRAGLLTAGAGAIVLVASCCARVGTYAAPSQELVQAGGFLFSSLADTAAFVLVAAASVLTARALGAAREP